MQDTTAAELRPAPSAPEPSTRTLLAKITMPSSPHCYLRQSLFRSLDQHSAKRLIWLAAPAGYGKTTAVSSYLSSPTARAIWYQCDEGDVDIGSFFHYMTLAVEPLLAHGDLGVPRFQAEYLEDVPTFARNYFRAVFAALQRSTTLVLDDWQEVPDEAPLAQLLPLIAQQIPEGIRLIVISRRAPPPPLARMAASQHLIVLGVDELRYSKADTQAICQAEDRHPLDIDQLQNLTQGWPIGVALTLRSDCVALLSAADGKLPACPQEIFDYLATEVFDRLEERVQDFLLKTAFLESIPARLAARILEGSAAQSILGELVRQRAFILYRPLADSYEYHPLFRSFLRQRLQIRLGMGERAHWLISLAQMLCREGEPEAAIDLFLRAESYEQAVAAMCSVAQTLVQQARQRTLLGWIDALPKCVTDAHPWLTYWYGVCQLTTAFPLAAASLKRAYDGFRSAQDQLGQLLACSAILQHITYCYADYAPMRPWIARLEQLLDVNPVFPSQQVELQIKAAFMLAMSQAVPSHPRLFTIVSDVSALVASEADLQIRAEGLTALLHFFSRFGRTAQYGDLDSQLAAILNDARLQPLQRLRLMWLDAYRIHLSGDPGRVLEILSAARALARHEGIASEDMRMRVCELQAQEAGHSTAVGLATFSELEPLMRSLAAIPLAHFLYVRAIFELGAGRLSQALVYAEESVPMMRSSHWHIGAALTLTGLGEVYCALGRYSDAARCVRECEEITSGVTAPLVAFNALLVQAEVTRCVGTEEELAAALGRALSLGRQQGYANTFHTGSRLLKTLLPQSLRLGVETSYCQWVIKKRGFKPPSPDTPQWPWPVRVRTFGQLTITVADEVLTFSGKPQRKPLDLLKLLVTDSRGIDAAHASDLLWPELEGDKARNALDLALHRLRKILGSKESVIMSDGLITLSPDTVWVDTFALQRMSRLTFPLKDSRYAVALLLDIYRAPFLGAEHNIAPIAAQRERTRNLFVRTVLNLAATLRESGRWPLHSHLCQQALEREPLEERLGHELTRGLLNPGQNGQAQIARQRYERAPDANPGKAISD